MCGNSSCSLNSENPYATIRDPPAGPACKHTESSYVEMKSPAHREVPFGGTATLLGAAGRNVEVNAPSASVSVRVPLLHMGLSLIRPLEPTVSVLQGPNGMATGFSQSPYDLPRGGGSGGGGGHVHYDILPMRHSPTHTPPAATPESPSSLL
ncbi:hypothetical protein CRUP_031998 [Coryphaenoides rupestris]|nr:hypothetical protein CRUP_031998 [Coryphaenoides rupestris]